MYKNRHLNFFASIKIQSTIYEFYINLEQFCIRLLNFIIIKKCSLSFIILNKKLISIENSSKVGKSRQAGWRRVVRANHLIDMQFHIIYSNGKHYYHNFLIFHFSIHNKYSKVSKCNTISAHILQGHDI